MITPPPRVAVIGGGPAGLMAAETLVAGGASVVVLDRMPSFGRKLLMAGRGGLNLTHSTPLPGFLDRYGAAREGLRPAIAAFPPAALIEWCNGLGQETFVGSSLRVFPTALKASPLLRAWLRRLTAQGVAMRTRADWAGWDAQGQLLLRDGSVVAADAVVLALGGASWPRLGADGGWVSLLPDIEIAPLRPANCSFTVAWSDIFRSRFAGTPLKRIAMSFSGRTIRGEAVVTEGGIEGGAIYALSSALRDAIEAGGPARITLDLRPDLDAAELASRLDVSRRGQSLSTFLRKTAGLAPVAIGLVQEALHAGATDPAALIKALPITLVAPAPIARAISTAGGIAWSGIDENMMLRRRPGVFVAGEMLDWEAPTGGFLLQACFSTGQAAGRGALAWLKDRAS